MKSLCLDPSINNVGWSVFDTKKKNKADAWRWGTWNLQGANLEMRIMDLIGYIDEDILKGGLELGNLDFLITEKPTFFSSERGHIAAHMNYTIDLAAINYYVAGHYHFNHRQHFAITATMWKGSIGKNVTARRFFRAYPEVHQNSLSEHAIDSIMLHRFWIQTFLIRMKPPQCPERISPVSLLKLI